MWGALPPKWGGTVAARRGPIYQRNTKAKSPLPLGRRLSSGSVYQPDLEIRAPERVPTSAGRFKTKTQRMRELIVSTRRQKEAQATCYGRRGWARLPAVQNHLGPTTPATAWMCKGLRGSIVTNWREATVSCSMAAGTRSWWELMRSDWRSTASCGRTWCNHRICKSLLGQQEYGPRSFLGGYGFARALTSKALSFSCRMKDGVIQYMSCTALNLFMIAR